MGPFSRVVPAVLLLVCVLSLLGLLGTRTVLNIVFDRGAEGYLKRAADANSVELAKENLGVAVKYARENGMTNSYTSIVWAPPDEDVGFWFNNLTASYKELEAVRAETTPLERSNLLIKLRETLLDNSEGGTKVTAPKGISVYPYNTAFALLGVLSILGIVVFFFAAVRD